MANISSYPIITPKPSDLVLVVQTYLAGVSTETGNPTKTARVSDFLSLGVQSLTTVGTSGAATLNAGVLNIPNYANTQNSLTTTGAGAATLVGTVLNIPTPVIPFTSLTTNGTSGAATLSSGILNIPTPSSSVAAPLEYNAGLTQTGTGAPNPTANKQINTLEVSGTAYRFLNFTRVSTGTYFVEIIYENTLQPTDSNKVSVSLGFGNCRIIAKVLVNAGAASTIRYTFETYTPGGVLADGQMTGTNGGFLNIKLYP